ncbi:hypothetical protein GCM10009555_037700 [Acrocarpospora macrocephala]|uniref:ARB-07466-like C-terminal domain-containing protein n=1 Tax=Acrocarpospora macrocephala TaxID=150177 RepID=A0A5M3X4R6_9ACTN|nr:hypothetical protein [Acrocarpospora macrocephala]GES15119.1 hypothetical protein Amac_087160 [Acrocarpospora macrocephala]
MSVGVLAAALVLGPVATAAPKPTEGELKKQLTSLEKKVDGLIAKYHVAREDLAKARTAEKAARARLVKAEADYVAAQHEVGKLAGLNYQATVDPRMLMPGMQLSPLAAQLQAEKAAKMTEFAKKEKERRDAAAAAKKLIVDIKQQSEDIERQRKDAEQLIDEIQEKLNDLIPMGPGKLANGGWAPELPTGSDNITPRTRLMREEIKDAFKLHYTVGCFRVDNMGEHPLGRACDFMMSSGGAMPTAANAALGDKIADWALKNRTKLGVKYVIWKQRINHGSGWRLMGNRGGITANHYDHVHISMF